MRDGWKEMPLGEVVSQVLDFRGRTPLKLGMAWGGGTIPALSAINVRDGRLDLTRTPHFGSDALYDRWMTQGDPERGDVLITTEAPLGNIAQVPDDRRYILSQRVILLKPRKGLVEPNFLALQMRGAHFQSLLNDNRSGTTATGIRQSRLVELRLQVPPLNEQRRIVAKLEALQSRSRRAREALDAVPPLLEKLRQSILAAAFRGDLTKDWRAQNPNPEPASALLARIRTERRKKWEEAELAKLKAKGKPPTNDSWKAKYKEPEPVDTTGLPELPEGWCWASLSDLAWDCGYGTSEKCSYEAAGAPVLRIPNIARGLVDLGDVKRTLHTDDMRDLFVAPGDLLIVRTNGSRDLIGRAAIVTETLPEPTSFASYLIRFRLVTGGSAPAWVGQYWESSFIRTKIEEHAASSAGQYNVSLGELSGCPVPVAPFAEQSEALRAIHKAMETHLTVERSVADAFLHSGELERALLAKAFRGELVPQDPSDEPADVMLSRLKGDVPAESPRRRSRGAKAAE
jgi:type I restriction enzyme, S subunit